MLSSRLPSRQFIHQSSSFIMYCGIHTNRKWNYVHVSVLPVIFVSCSLTIEEVGRHSFPLKQLFYFILIYFILFYFISFYFILFYFILFYFILFYFILFYFILSTRRSGSSKIELGRLDKLFKQFLDM